MSCKLKKKGKTEESFYIRKNQIILLISLLALDTYVSPPIIQITNAKSNRGADNTLRQVCVCTMCCNGDYCSRIAYTSSMHFLHFCANLARDMPARELCIRVRPLGDAASHVPSRESQIATDWGSPKTTCSVYYERMYRERDVSNRAARYRRPIQAQDPSTINQNAADHQISMRHASYSIGEKARDVLW